VECCKKSLQLGQQRVEFGGEEGEQVVSTEYPHYLADGAEEGEVVPGRKGPELFQL